MSTTTAPPTPEPEGGAAPSRGRIVLARTLTVIGILLLVVSMLANYVKREALDEGRFRATSRALIADDAIRSQVAATLVDQLYTNVDIADSLAGKLPDNLQGLAGPIAGIAREAADRTAQQLLQRPRVQDAFVNATSLAQKQFIAVLDGNTKILDTTGGKVVLDVRPLVLDLGDRFSFIPDLAQRIPESAARVTILESDQLSTAQDLTKALRAVASWVWVLVLAAWGAAIWVARGRRRIETRAIAIGIVVAGFLVLVVRTLAGRSLVDELVVSDSVKPAVSNAYDILTRLLVGAGWTAVIVGLVALIGVWVTGAGVRATSLRRALAPYLRRPEIAFGALVVAYLLLLWWQPTPQFGYAINILIFFVLALIGLEVIRRQAAREFPDAEAGSPLAAIRGAFDSARKPAATTDTTSELERLAGLHAAGELDDAEYAAAKRRLLGG